jgi:hypothetical protein
VYTENTMNNLCLPSIRIKHGWLVDLKLQQVVQKYNQDCIFEPNEEILQKIEQYRNTWKKEETTILKNVCDVLGLKFARPIIDVYIVTALSGAISDPLIISSKTDLRIFNDMLTHEILHVLLTDNVQQMPVASIWSEMFPNENKRTQNLEVLKNKERLEADIERCRKFDIAFTLRAWEVVEKMGYKRIIEEFQWKIKDSMHKNEFPLAA